MSRLQEIINSDSFPKPKLDPGFVPAVLWNRDYQTRVDQSGQPCPVAIALIQPDESCSIFHTRILPMAAEYDVRTLQYLERILKFLLWQRGGSRVLVAGCDHLVGSLSAIYSPNGERSFDYEFFGRKIYREPLTIRACPVESLPESCEKTRSLGRHLDGCRIGFDLGGSDRKCAALVDGKVVFSEEVEWNPYFETDPNYHLDGINDSLQRAAAHLPRVDAIGGSAAGVYVHNEIRTASLFRGISSDDFEQRVRHMFFDLKERWGNIPFEVTNDGDVTALAGSMAMHENAVLGISMGTSLATGYVNALGKITPWLNELAFAPLDVREDAPRDEWSGDLGCGVQYLSQQAVARLAPWAGLTFADRMPFAERLVKVQEKMADGDERAAKIYATLGTYLGYAVAHYADFYDIRKVLLLGRVTSGEGGALLLDQAVHLLDVGFPDLAGRIEIETPGEKDKRHGQAVAAASLPALGARS